MKKHYLFNVFIELISLNEDISLSKHSRHQCVARGMEGNILINHYIGVRIEIYKGGEGDTGIIVYSEIHDITTNMYGLITLNIGKGKENIGIFSDIEWSSDNFYIKIEMDENCGANS